MAALLVVGKEPCIITKDNVDDGELDFSNITKPLEVVVTAPSDPELQKKQQLRDRYKLPVNNKGYALVLNIKAFDKQARRDGSEHDVRYMTELWAKLGYKIYPGKEVRNKERKTEDDVRRIVKAFKKKCVANKAESIVIFVGSHGVFQKIVTSDEKRFDLYDGIFDKFTTKACECMMLPDAAGNCQDCTRWLGSIPKMFFVNACQEFEERLRPEGEEIRANTDYHAALLSAQYPGKPAFRSEAFGSKFAYALTHVFMKNAHNVELWKLMGMVIEVLVKAKGNIENKQLAHSDYLGIMELYFTMDSVN